MKLQVDDKIRSRRSSWHCYCLCESTQVQRTSSRKTRPGLPSAERPPGNSPNSTTDFKVAKLGCVVTHHRHGVEVRMEKTPVSPRVVSAPKLASSCLREQRCSCESQRGPFHQRADRLRVLGHNGFLRTSSSSKLGSERMRSSYLALSP